MGFRERLSEKFHSSSGQSSSSIPHPTQSSNCEPYNATPVPQAPNYGYQSYNPGYSAPPQGYGYGYSTPPAAQGLPYPWIAEYDPNSRQYYYVNSHTGERSWQAPSAYCETQDNGAAFAAPAYTSPSYNTPSYAAPAPSPAAPGTPFYSNPAVAPPVAAAPVMAAPVVAPAPPVDPYSATQQVPTSSGDRDDSDDQGMEKLKENTSELVDKIHANGDDIGDGISELPEKVAYGAGEMVGTIKDIPDDIEEAPNRMSRWWSKIRGEVEDEKEELEEAFESGEEDAEGSDSDDSSESESESDSDDDDDDDE